MAWRRQDRLRILDPGAAVWAGAIHRFIILEGEPFMKHYSALAAIFAALPAALPCTAGASGGDRFEGTWINDVKIVSCQSPQTVLAAFQSLTTYSRDGTLIEGGGAAAPPPGVSRSAGHGIWERTGGHTFQVWFRSHALDGLGRLVRITEVSSQPTLVMGDNPGTAEVEPYHLVGWGTNKITNIDAATGAVTSVVQGCNYAASRPVLFAN